MRHSSKPWAFDANDSEEDLATCIVATLFDANVEPKALNHTPLWASSRMQMISAGTAKNDSEIGTAVLDFLDDELNVIAEWLYDRGVVYRPAWPLMGRGTLYGGHRTETDVYRKSGYWILWPDGNVYTLFQRDGVDTLRVNDTIEVEGTFTVNIICGESIKHFFFESGRSLQLQCEDCGSSSSLADAVPLSEALH